jgi:hypothetical protein
MQIESGSLEYTWKRKLYSRTTMQSKPETSILCDIQLYQNGTVKQSQLIQLVNGKSILSFIKNKAKIIKCELIWKKEEKNYSNFYSAAAAGMREWFFF